MSIVFFGSPQFAVPSLKTLIDAGETVAAVVTQPDKAKGRGRKHMPSPVKECALENGIRVLTPLSMKDEAFLSEIESLKPEFLVVVAFGRILTKRILDLPSGGTVNVHASLLPRYRGASPVTWAILKGDSETGVTTMLMDEGLDTGAILLEEPAAIAEDDTAGSLSVKLSDMGGTLLIRTLRGMREGNITPVPQGDSPTEYARLLTKEDGHVDWSKGTVEIHNIVRALSPWPSAFCFINGKRVKLTVTAPGEPRRETGDEGTVTGTDPDYFEVATGSGTLRVLKLQPEGKKPMSARDFMLGHKLRKGERLD